jgi:glycine/D-amino acid oxidase-like deaminating enzyme
MSERGVSWFAHGQAGWEADSLRVLGELGIPAERLTVSEAAQRFPSLAGDELEWVLHEPEAGVLRAQQAVQALARRAAARGAEIVRGRAAPEGERVRLADGTVLEGDRVVWSCGGWLARLFGELVQVRVTYQPLLFFDGGPAWRDAPAWVDYDRAWYGTGDVDGLGVKIAWDAEGPPGDPDAELPPTTPEAERVTRGYAAERFPALADAPLAGAKTCRYELTPDSEFIAAPVHESVWIVGGGSGHGFKHGPAMAERIVAAWDGTAELPSRFSLGRRERGTSLRTAGS